MGIVFTIQHIICFLYTFNQLLISIQAQILVDEPYFNEPGYEKYIGKSHGIQNSKKYNYNIRKYTLDHTINDMLADVISEKKRYPEFSELIKLRKKKLKKTVTRIKPKLRLRILLLIKMLILYKCYFKYLFKKNFDLFFFLLDNIYNLSSRKKLIFQSDYIKLII